MLGRCGGFLWLDRQMFAVGARVVAGLLYVPFLGWTVTICVTVQLVVRLPLLGQERCPKGGEVEACGSELLLCVGGAAGFGLDLSGAARQLSLQRRAKGERGSGGAAR